MSSFSYLVNNGYRDLAELMLATIPTLDVNVKDKDGRTPLMYACKSGNQKFVETLLNRSASPNVSDNDGKTPLMIAISEPWLGEHTDIVQLLLNRGASTQVRDKGRQHLSDFGKILKAKQNRSATTGP